MFVQLVMYQCVIIVNGVKFHFFCSKRNGVFFCLGEMRETKQCEWILLIAMTRMFLFWNLRWFALVSLNLNMHVIHVTCQVRHGVGTHSLQWVHARCFIYELVDDDDDAGGWVMFHHITFRSFKQIVWDSVCCTINN